MRRQAEGPCPRYVRKCNNTAIFGYARKGREREGGRKTIDHVIYVQFRLCTRVLSRIIRSFSGKCKVDRFSAYAFSSFTYAGTALALWTVFASARYYPGDPAFDGVLFALQSVFTFVADVICYATFVVLWLIGTKIWRISGIEVLIWIAGTILGMFCLGQSRRARSEEHASWEG
eukprot:jgi/Bigna1/64405/fgenesh1_kg.74_\